MSEDVASRLRELARDHSEERLTLSAYRRLRTPLLDSLSARGSTTDGPEVTTQPRAKTVSPTSVPRPPEPRATPPEQPATPPTVVQPRLQKPPRLTRGVLVGTLLLLVGALGVGAWLAWGTRTGAGPGPAASAQQSAAGSQSDPLRTELQAVLDSDDWSDARLSRTNALLVEAGSQHVRAVAGTAWFERFSDAVRQRIKEQQALGTPLTPDKSPLAALAATIGIELAPEAGPATHSAGERAAAQRPPAAAGSPRSEPALPAGATAAAVAPQGAAQGGAAAQTGSAGTAENRRASSATPSAAPTSGSRTGQPAASGMGGSTGGAAATAPAGAATPGQTTACNRRFCRDPLPSGEPGIQVAIIPGGSFTMGNAGAPNERPAHQVTIRQSFAISVEEVSQAEFRWYCGKAGRSCPAQPSWTGDDYPVVNVSWNDAIEYARWLSQVTGKHYRLPTEAEWEYAARAGQNGLFPSGESLNPVDAYFSDKVKLTAPAPRGRDKEFNPNAWHIYHMVGNVREWVQDSWEASFEGAPSDGSARERTGALQKVVRGGSYADERLKLRLTTREPLNADARDDRTGIRLVREIP